MGNGDSRTLFRDQVHQLLNNSEYDCSGLFLFPESLEDVITMLPLSDVQVLQSKSPRSLEQLTDKALELLEQQKDEKDQSTAVNAARVLCRVLGGTCSNSLWWGRERRALRLLSILVYYQLDPGHHPPFDIQYLLLVTMSCRLSDPVAAQSDFWRWVLCSGSIPSAENLFERLLLSAVESTGWRNRHQVVQRRHISLLIFLALLDFRACKVEGDLSETAQLLLEGREMKPCNVFEENLANFTRPDWMQDVTRGLMDTLCNYAEFKNAVLPTLELPFYAETLLLLARLLRVNSSFLEHLCKSPRVVQILRPLLELMAEGEDGVVAAGCTCLLRLSIQEPFTSALSQVCVDRSPARWALFTGSYADLLVIAVCHILEERQELVLRKQLAGVLQNV